MPRYLTHAHIYTHMHVRMHASMAAGMPRYECALSATRCRLGQNPELVGPSGS